MKQNNLKRAGFVFDYKELRKKRYVMYVTKKTKECWVLFNLNPINDMYLLFKQ
jgi:hypothetical protein